MIGFLTGLPLFCLTGEITGSEIWRDIENAKKGGMRLSQEMEAGKERNEFKQMEMADDRR